MQFAALLAPIDRIRPGQRTPFLARTDAASTIADDQSSSPRAPSSSNTARCSLRHNPASVHTANRRCAVAGETPNDSGRNRHAHPLVSTYTTAVNTARSSTGAVPPPCGRDANPGSNGAASSHSSSGTSRRDRSTPTIRHHAASTDHHVRHPLRHIDLVIPDGSPEAGALFRAREPCGWPSSRSRMSRPPSPARRHPPTTTAAPRRSCRASRWTPRSRLTRTDIAPARPARRHSAAICASRSVVGTKYQHPPRVEPLSGHRSDPGLPRRRRRDHLAPQPLLRHRVARGDPPAHRRPP